MPTVTKATSRKRGAAKTVRAAQRTPLPMLDLPADAVRGLSTTGMVHWACPTGSGRLEQLCGAGPKQHAYLSPAPDAAVSCKRCLGRYGDSKIKEIAQVQDALSDNLDTFGMPELRQLAKAKGVTVPFGAKKTALVALLRGEATEATEATEAAPAEGAIKRGTPAHLKVPQFDPKASAAKDADENREKFSKLQREIGARLVQERKRFTRPKLAEHIGLTPSELWRCEQGRARAHEIEKIQAVFARIDSGELVPPEKPKPFGGANQGTSKAKLKDTLDQIEHVLTSVPVKSSVTQLRAAVNAALELIEKARA